MKKLSAIFLALGMSALLPRGAAAAAADNLPTGGNPTAALLEDNPTLADYVNYAVTQNPGLQAAQAHWEAARASIHQAKGLPDPQFSYAYYIEEVQTRVGPQEQSFGLSQRLPWVGTLRLRGALAETQAKAAYEAYQMEKQKLIHDVKEAYYEFAYLHRALLITEDNIRLLSDLEKVAQAKYRAGAPMYGVVKAQVELGKLDDRLKTLKEQRTPVTARLNTVLNRPTNAPLPWPDAPPYHDIKLSEEDLVRRLTENNPGLKSLDHLRQKAQQSVTLARRENLPDLKLGLNYIDTGQALNQGVSGSGKDPVIASIAVDLPIWRSKNRAAVDQSRKQHQAALETYTNRKNQLLTDLQWALFRFRDAQRKMNLYKDTLIPQATLALSVSDEAYQAGSIDFLGLIDAQRLLLEFQLEYERTMIDRELHLVIIEMLVGTSLTDPFADPATGDPQQLLDDEERSMKK